METISLSKALELKGVNLSKRGTAKFRACILDGCKAKHYTIKRNTDGHLTYRWGRLISAKYHKESGTICFIPEHTS